MKFTLSHKAIILVSIPLLFEFIFLGALAYLLGQAEKESTLIFKSANIGHCSNKLIKDIFELSTMPHHEIIDLFASSGYKAKVETVRSDLKELLIATKDDRSEQLVARRSIEAGEEAFELIQHIETTFEAGDSLSAIEQLKQLRVSLRDCIGRMISNDLITMAQTEKQKAEQYHAKQLALRNLIQLVLVAGLVLNAVITFLVAFIISKKIVGRLAIIVENNFLLASGMQLRPPLDGNDEISELDKTFHQLADSLARAKEKEKSIIEHSADVICSLDSDGKVITANPASKRVLGYSEEMILGLNLRSILVNDDIESFNRILSDAKTTKTEMEFESRINQKNGDSIGIIDVLWSIHWVDSERSFFCVGHDITQRKELERIKQQFMAMISHDLRTPLTTISNYLELLSAGILGELTDKGKHLLTIGEQNVSHMLSLINDLLDLEKADFGGLKLDCSAQKVNELIEQAVKSITNLAVGKNVEIMVDSTELSVLADNKRILQVLTNLLNNAIKFSPKNSKIVLAARQVNNMACISISDEGRGIPDDMKLAIFERFRQVRSTDSTELVGSGLGLAICKAIVELHGGKIQVEDSPSGGSTFSFSLPLVEAELNIN